VLLPAAMLRLGQVGGAWSCATARTRRLPPAPRQRVCAADSGVGPAPLLLPPLARERQCRSGGSTYSPGLHSLSEPVGQRAAYGADTGPLVRAPSTQAPCTHTASAGDAAPPFVWMARASPNGQFPRSAALPATRFTAKRRAPPSRVRDDAGRRHPAVGASTSREGADALEPGRRSVASPVLTLRPVCVSECSFCDGCGRGRSVCWRRLRAWPQRGVRSGPRGGRLRRAGFGSG
jgi:hypothetical protein